MKGACDPEMTWSVSQLDEVTTFLATESNDLAAAVRRKEAIDCRSRSSEVLLLFNPLVE